MTTHAIASTNEQPLARGAYRFLFVYLVLYMLPFPLYLVPFFYYAYTPLVLPLQKFYNAVGPWFFHNTYSPFNGMTGSGDTSFKYTQTFVYLIVAAAVALVWTLASRRNTHPKLEAGLLVMVRYYLATFLFSYGFQKLLPLQFPRLTSARLTQTYGESSPMGLLWTFMGASPGYTMLTGMVEVMAGVLLLFKRTRLLGALVAVVAMTQVFALNVFYDVPVKLFSFHLLLMAMVLTAPDWKRLLNVLVLNKPAPPAADVALVPPGKWKWAALGVKAIVIFFIFFQPIASFTAMKNSADEKMESMAATELKGDFEVSAFVLNGDTLTAGKAPTRCWSRLQIGGSRAFITFPDGMSTTWYCSIRNGAKRVRLLSRELGTPGEFDFTFDGERLTLHGTMNNDTLSVVSRRTSHDVYLLETRGFHWINEEPYYR